MSSSGSQMSRSGSQVHTQQGMRSSMGLGTGLAILGGVVGFVISFFNWYGVTTSTGASTDLNGWHGWGVASAILLLAGALVALARAAGFAVESIGTEAATIVVLGVAAVVTTIIFMVTEGSGYGTGFDKGPLYGAYIGLISAIVMTIGGAWMTREAN